MQQPGSSKKATVFFPNLDGLRFFSFLAVFLYHCYLSFFSNLQTTSPGFYNTIQFLFRNGYLGVNFFFVLSGFLITYLLLTEKRLNGTIHVGKFYVRRILRIWPLYYLCVVIGFVLFPMIKQMSGESSIESANPLYYALFLANFDYMHTWPVKPDAILLSVLWSVAVEEQFYLTWPLMLKLIARRFYPLIFPFIILLVLVFRSFYTGNTEADHAVRYFHTFSLIGDMAVGGWFAYLLSYENRFHRFIVAMPALLIAGIYICTILIVLFKNYLFPCGIPVIFERLVIALFFGMIIADQNFSKHSLFKMGRFKTVTRLGIYTYALYCLHLLGMYGTVKLIGVMQLSLQSSVVATAASVAALLIAIVISYCSYHLFEKWFLRLKDKFAFIVKQ
jgi:peptidoglycan/LPS O-acetylase OafA/YrhL